MIRNFVLCILFFASESLLGQDTTYVYLNDSNYVQNQFGEEYSLAPGCLCTLKDSLPDGYYILTLEYKNDIGKEYTLIEGGYMNGKREGKFLKYHIKKSWFRERKRLSKSETYRNGLLEGAVIIRSPFNHLNRIKFFKKGILNGPAIFFNAENEVILIYYYEDGEFIRSEEY